MKENLLEPIRAGAFLLFIIGAVLIIQVVGWKFIVAGYIMLMYSLFGYFIDILKSRIYRK